MTKRLEEHYGKGILRPQSRRRSYYRHLMAWMSINLFIDYSADILNIGFFKVHSSLFSTLISSKK
ncbi:hypothetical protein SHINM1_016130 [Fluviibacter phosphoraccumulans]|nr:hypothetical protein SHINM1_016130 [Fluviibacter phosphoraccumulans]